MTKAKVPASKPNPGKPVARKSGRGSARAFKQPREFERVGRVSTASVHKGTGKHWDEWIPILNKAGAKNWSHSEIVKYLAKKHKLTPWWQQGVALGYEVATGKRVDGQNHKGEYALVVTRAFDCSPKTLWQVIASDEGIKAWLRPMGEFEIKPKQQYEIEGGVYGEVRTVKPGARLRMSWQEEDWAKATTVSLLLVMRKNKTTMFAIQHDGLKSARQKEELRALWKDRLEALTALMNREG